MDEIAEVIIVEGRYDKHTLQNVVRATVIETRGYGIFSDKDRVKLIRRLAKERGVIILTDSDNAGRLIRNHLKGQIPDGRVLHAYIPDRPGKERRKTTPAKAGLLGVEGMDRETLLCALRRAGATLQSALPLPDGKQAQTITKAHLYQMGLTGKPDSVARRRALLSALNLPQNLTTNGMLDVLNILLDYDRLVDFLAVHAV